VLNISVQFVYMLRKIALPLCFCAAAVLVFAYILVQHSGNNVPVSPVYEKTAPLIVAAASSSVQPVLVDVLPSEDPQAYVPAVCGSKWPSTWHVRSSQDQAIWNTTGNGTVPAELTAQNFFQSLASTNIGTTALYPRFKPALLSVAASGTMLLGHSEDPGAEDSNRLELDVLRMNATEMRALLDRLQTPPSNFAWTTAQVGGVFVPALRSIEDDKYLGQELIFIAPELLQGNMGLILFNRSTYDLDYAEGLQFRLGLRHFLQSMRFEQCPSAWVR
jgi:hypothetical protein